MIATLTLASGREIEKGDYISINGGKVAKVISVKSTTDLKVRYFRWYDYIWYKAVKIFWITYRVFNKVKKATRRTSNYLSQFMAGTYRAMPKTNSEGE